MAGGLGINSWASVAPELVAYGTKSASTWHYFDYVSESIKVDRPPVKRRALRKGTLTSPQRGFYQGVKKVGGDIKLEFMFQGMLQFLKHACGGYAYAANTPVANAHTHTFTIADALPNYGLSMEVMRANLPADKVFLYTGGRVNKLDFNFKTGDIMELVAGMSFKEETPNTTPTATPTYATDYPVLWRYAGALTLCGEASTPFDGGSISINNNLSTDRFLMGETLPSPLRAAPSEITGSIVGEYESLSLHTKMLAMTGGALTLTFTSDSLITGSTYRSIAFSVPNIILEGDPPNVDGPGIVPYNLKWRSDYNGTDNPMTITVVTNETTLL